MRASFTPVGSPAATSLGTVKRTGNHQDDTPPAELIPVGTLPGMLSGPPLPGALGLSIQSLRKGCAGHPNSAHSQPASGVGRNRFAFDAPAHGGAEQGPGGDLSWSQGAARGSQPAGQSPQGGGELAPGACAWAEQTGEVWGGSQGGGPCPQKEAQPPPIPARPLMLTHGQKRAGWQNRGPGQQRWKRCKCRCPGAVGPHPAGPGCAAGQSWPACSPVCPG